MVLRILARNAVILAVIVLWFIVVLPMFAPVIAFAILFLMELAVAYIFKAIFNFPIIDWS